MRTTSSSDKPPVALVGAGAVGTALALRLAECGYSVQAVLSRTTESARRLADQVSASVATTTPGALPASVRLLFVCVPDDVLPQTARALADAPPVGSRCLAAHTSGAHPAHVLTPVEMAGARVLSFHPLQAFPQGASPSLFDGIYVGLEGDDEARSQGRAIARNLGATPMAVPPDAKARYHLAASIASNFLVTLAGMADEVLTSAHVPAGTHNALHPLREGTMHNLSDRSPEEAITGPIARGDWSVLARHLEALEAHLPHLVPAYAALALETLRLAIRGGHLSADDAAPMLALLRRRVTASSTENRENS